MMEHNAAVEIAKITYKQAVVVAAISALAGVLTTLITSEVLRSRGPVTAAALLPNESGPISDNVDQLRSENDSLRLQLETGQRQLAAATHERDAARQAISAALNRQDASQRPSAANNSRPIVGDMVACLDRAAAAMTSIGAFNVNKVQESVYGDAGSYLLAIRCEPRSNIAFFFVSGGNSQVAVQQTERLLGAFDRNSR
jgi:hypothetical protein